MSKSPWRFLTRLKQHHEPGTPDLPDETRWYTEHTALLISTLKWAVLGAAAGVCVGLRHARVFVVARRVGRLARACSMFGRVPFFLFCRSRCRFASGSSGRLRADARGHGTEAVIAAVHQRRGRIDWVRRAGQAGWPRCVTLAFGGSVGKEGPAAQIGAALTSLSPTCCGCADEDRRGW